MALNNAIKKNNITMKIDERLRVLKNELYRQIEYRLKVQSTGSTIDYSSEDFARESMLKRKIKETKEWQKFNNT